MGADTRRSGRAIVRTLDWFDANPYAWQDAVGSEARIA